MKKLVARVLIAVILIGTLLAVTKQAADARRAQLWIYTDVFCDSGWGYTYVLYEWNSACRCNIPVYIQSGCV